MTCSTCPWTGNKAVCAACKASDGAQVAARFNPVASPEAVSGPKRGKEVSRQEGGGRKGPLGANGGLWEPVVSILPMGKPRMTQRDKWKKRPSVVRYREYADELRRQLGQIPAGIGSLSWRAYFPLPTSWSKKKKAEMQGQPHLSKPDRDNIDKGILDALFPNGDSHVYRGSVLKLWDDGKGPRIEFEIREL